MKSKYLRLQSKHTKRCIDAFTVSRGWYCCCVVSHNDNHSCIDMVIFNIPTVGKRDSSRSKIRWNKSFIVYSKRLLANITRVHQLRCSASARSAAKRFQRLFWNIRLIDFRRPIGWRRCVHQIAKIFRFDKFRFNFLFGFERMSRI